MNESAIRPGSASGSAAAWWPICLWLGQLPIPVLVLAYGGIRFVRGPELTPRFWLILCAGGVWAAGVVIAVAWAPLRRRLVSNRYQLALCLGSVLLTVAVADVALTLTGVVPTIAARRANSLEYRASGCTKHRLVPKTFSAGDRENLTINSRGYLGPEIAIPKPPGTARIVFLGGSQVFDTYWSGGESWPATVGEILRKRGRKVDVINAGVPNHQTPDSLGKFVTDLWLTEPDLILVCNSWNDIKYFAELTPRRPYADVVPLWHGEDLRLRPRGLDRLLCCSALYRIGHDRLITTFKGVGDEGEKLREPVAKVTDSAVRQYRLTLQTICDVGKNIGAGVVLCKQARLPTADAPEQIKRRIPYDYTGLPHAELIQAFAECDRVIDEVAAEKRCRVIDLSGPLSGKPDVFEDHVHFSRKGSRQAARLVAEQLEPIINGL